jgi:hypothetical protein
MGCVREVLVAGRTIVRDGRVTGIDLEAAETELRQLYRANLPRYRALQASWPALEAAVGNWFGQHGCG